MVFFYSYEAKSPNDGQSQSLLAGFNWVANPKYAATIVRRILAIILAENVFYKKYRGTIFIDSESGPIRWWTIYITYIYTVIKSVVARVWSIFYYGYYGSIWLHTSTTAVWKNIPFGKRCHNSGKSLCCWWESSRTFNRAIFNSYFDITKW